MLEQAEESNSWCLFNIFSNIYTCFNVIYQLHHLYRFLVFLVFVVCRAFPVFHVYFISNILTQNQLTVSSVCAWSLRRWKPEPITNHLLLSLSVCALFLTPLPHPAHFNHPNRCMCRPITTTQQPLYRKNTHINIYLIECRSCRVRACPWTNSRSARILNTINLLRIYYVLAKQPFVFRINICMYA